MIHALIFVLESLLNILFSNGTNVIYCFLYYLTMQILLTLV